MKHILPFIFTIAIQLSAFCQIVVTEISYNPPETNTDSLEYLELFNAGNQAVNLRDYRFTQGITLTFPEVVINPQAYLLLSVNAAAIERNFGKTSVQWTSGALNNSGERLVMVDAGGTTVFDFTFLDVAPWPTVQDGTDGDGRSIEICQPGANPGDGNNWKVSTNSLGFTINDKEVFGTPGAPNSIPPCGVNPDTIVLVSNFAFTPKDITIFVGETIRWTNTGGTHNVNGSKDIFPANPVGFSSGSASSDLWNFDFTFTLPGVYQYQCDPHAAMNMKGTVTVNEIPVNDPYPLRTIPLVTATNQEGVPDSLGINCKLSGVVYGINQRPTGLQFTIIDAQNNGIAVYNGSGDLGYTVKEGDLIEVKGRIAQFRGLTQLELFEVRKVSENNPLVNSKQVTAFEEIDESSLIMVRNLSFVNPAQWTGSGSGFNVTMTNGSSEFTIRIDNDVDLYSQPLPSNGPFQVVGLLGQFAPQQTPPFSGGYQLLPRYMMDFMTSSNTENEQSSRFQLSVSPNPADDRFTIISDQQVESVRIYDTSGKLMLQNQGQKTIEIHQLKPGVYVIESRIAGVMYTGKLVKL